MGESVELVRAGSYEGVLIESDTCGTLMIEADRVQIQQVIITLARNGCEATAGLPNGHVALSTCVEGDRAIVSVEDTGPGIDASRSFDLFEEAISTKAGGMGMGLSISRTIVDAHDGRIWLASREKGRIRFRFSVPLTCAAAPMEGATLPPPAADYRESEGALRALAGRRGRDTQTRCILTGCEGHSFVNSPGAGSRQL